MIPLFLLAIALSAVALTQESEREREHKRALQDAIAAHRAVIAHLTAARTAPDPETAVRRAHAAAAANRVAAQAAVIAAQMAQTADQRGGAALSASEVGARGEEITETLADAHLEAATRATDPTIAAQHAYEAAEANREAAQKTIEAAKALPIDQPSAPTARRIAKVVDREDKIAAVLARLGAGQCGVRTYEHVTSKIKDALLAKLHAEGMVVTGDNPWDIETHQFDVKLRAVWDPTKHVLKVIVTAGKGGFLGLVTCDEIWKKIDPIMKKVLT